MKKLIYILGLIALSGVIISCEREAKDFTMTDTNEEALNVTGQWEVMAHNDSVPIFGPFQLLTISNSTGDNDSIVIQDSEVKFWNFQVKAAIDQLNGTFKTDLSTCEICDEGVGIKIANGIIIDSDSIYFEIQFEDDVTPYGNTYRLKGHRVKG